MILKLQLMPFFVLLSIENGTLFILLFLEHWWIHNCTTAIQHTESHKTIGELPMFEYNIVSWSWFFLNFTTFWKQCRERGSYQMDSYNEEL